MPALNVPELLEAEINLTLVYQLCRSLPAEELAALLDLLLERPVDE